MSESSSPRRNSANACVATSDTVCFVRRARCASWSRYSLGIWTTSSASSSIATSRRNYRTASGVDPIHASEDPDDLVAGVAQGGRLAHVADQPDQRLGVGLGG